MIDILITILLSAVKFAMTFPIAILQFQFDFLEVIIWTNVGGILGIYFFAFLSARLIAWWNRTFKRPGQAVPGGTVQGTRSHEKKIFTRRNRRIVRIKKQYGLIGIAISTPFLLSIPVGTFLVERYYRHNRSRFIYLIASNLVWSVIYAGFYLFWDELIFRSV